MGRVPCGENHFFFCGKAGCFYFALVFACPAGATAQPLAASPPYGWGVPPAGKTTFSFAGQKKKRFWTPKKKKKTSGNLGEVRYNRIEGRFCWVVPRVKSFGLSFYLRRPAFERPVAPLAPLPFGGWNTAPCSLVSTPPEWWFSGEGRAGRVRTPAPTGWDGFLMGGTTPQAV